MPLFAAVVMVLRRNRRTQAVIYPIARPSLWRLLAEEVRLLLRRVWSQFAPTDPGTPRSKSS